MFNLVRELVKKSTYPYLLDDLKAISEEDLLNFKDKDNANIVHHAYYYPEMVEYLYNLNPEWFYELDRKGTSPLLKIIQSQKKYAFIKDLLINYKPINQQVDKLISLYTVIFLDEECVEIILKKNIYLNEEAKSMVYKSYPKMFHYIEPNYWKKYNLTYYRALPVDTEQLLDNPQTKRDKKVISECIKDGHLNDFLLNIYVLAKNIDLNLDLVFNAIKMNREIYNAYLYQNEIDSLELVLSKLKTHYKDKRLIKLYFSLAENDMQNIALEILTNMIDDEKLTKPNTLYDLYNFYKGRRFLKKQEEILEEELNQELLFLDDKYIDDTFYIKVPKTNRELIQASIYLNICVGWGAYYEKIKNFESQIVFLYKNNRMFACAELDPKQYYQINEIKRIHNQAVDESISRNLQKLIDTHIGRFIDKI